MKGWIAMKIYLDRSVWSLDRILFKSIFILSIVAAGSAMALAADNSTLDEEIPALSAEISHGGIFSPQPSVWISPPDGTTFSDPVTLTTFVILPPECCVIENVEYSIDNDTSWTEIRGIRLTGNDIWIGSGWSLDGIWDSLSNSLHTIYFRVDMSKSPYCDNTNCGLYDNTNCDLYYFDWQFFKDTSPTPEPSGLEILQPNGGEVLTRAPFDIMWSLANPNDVKLILLEYSRDGGRSYQLIDKIFGPATRYIWSSPPIQTSEARIRVTAKYDDGEILSDESDEDFTIKRYSFIAGPRPGYSTGSGSRLGYSFKAGPRPGYSFKAGTRPGYSFRTGR